MRWLNARLRTRAQAVSPSEPLTLTLRIRHVCSSSHATTGWSTGMNLSIRASVQGFNVRKSFDELHADFYAAVTLRVVGGRVLLRDGSQSAALNPGAFEGLLDEGLQ